MKGQQLNDINFIHADLDFSIRCVVDGAPIIISDVGGCYEDRGDGKHLNENGYRAAAWLHDDTLVKKLWSNNNIDDWKNNLGNIKRLRPHEPYDSNAPDFLTKSQGINLPR